MIPLVVWSMKQQPTNLRSKVLGSQTRANLLLFVALLVHGAVSGFLYARHRQTSGQGRSRETHTPGFAESWRELGVPLLDIKDLSDHVFNYLYLLCCIVWVVGMAATITSSRGGEVVYGTPSAWSRGLLGATLLAGLGRSLLVLPMWLQSPLCLASRKKHTDHDACKAFLFKAGFLVILWVLLECLILVLMVGNIIAWWRAPRAGRGEQMETMLVTVSAGVLEGANHQASLYGLACSAFRDCRRAARESWEDWWALGRLATGGAFGAKGKVPEARGWEGGGGGDDYCLAEYNDSCEMLLKGVGHQRQNEDSPA